MSGLVMTPNGCGKVVSSTKNGWHDVVFPNKTVIKYRTGEISKVNGLVNGMVHSIEKSVHGKNRRSSKKIHKRLRRKSSKS